MKIAAILSIAIVGSFVIFSSVPTQAVTGSIVWLTAEAWDAGTKQEIDGVYGLETRNDNPSVGDGWRNRDSLWVASMYGDEFSIPDNDGETWRWVAPVDAAYSETADVWIANSTIRFAGNDTGISQSATRTSRTFVSSFNMLEITPDLWLIGQGRMTFAIVDTNATLECVFCDGWNTSSAAMGIGFNLTRDLGGTYLIQAWTMDGTGIQECGSARNAYPYFRIWMQSFATRARWVGWFADNSAEPIADCDFVQTPTSYFVMDFSKEVGYLSAAIYRAIKMRPSYVSGFIGSQMHDPVNPISWTSPSSGRYMIPEDATPIGFRIVTDCYTSCDPFIWGVEIRDSTNAIAWASSTSDDDFPWPHDWLREDIVIDTTTYTTPYRFVVGINTEEFVDSPGGGYWQAVSYPKWVERIEVRYTFEIAPPIPPIGEVDPVIVFVIDWLGPFLCAGIFVVIVVASLGLLLRFKRNRSP